MSERSHPPSIRDVAAVAGVSHQTVSRVLNEHPSVRPTTKQHVLDAIAELGYRPNVAARTLASSRSKLIGILTSSLQFYGPSAAVVSIESAAHQAGYWVNTAHIDEDDPASVSLGISHLLAQAVEGIVVIAPQQGVFEALSRMSIEVPYVTLQGSLWISEHSMAVNQLEGARQATRYLIDLGHRRLCHLAGPVNWIEAEARSRGFTEEVIAHGLEALPPIVGDWTAESGYRASAEVLATGCTAVVCANDQMAVGLMHGIHAAGLRVPGDISVVGFDDIPEAAHLVPPLTTVRQDFAELGRRCVTVLVASIEGQPPARTELIKPQLLVRESAAAPR